jgi:hypothetical protein
LTAAQGLPAQLFFEYLSTLAGLYSMGTKNPILRHVFSRKAETMFSLATPVIIFLVILFGALAFLPLLKDSTKQGVE